MPSNIPFESFGRRLVLNRLGGSDGAGEEQLSDVVELLQGRRVFVAEKICGGLAIDNLGAGAVRRTLLKWFHMLNAKPNSMPTRVVLP